MQHDTLADTFNWFQAALPNPEDINFHTQLGVHFEEVGEMIDAISALDPETAAIMGTARQAIGTLSKHLKGATDRIIVHQFDRAEYLDAICDQIVTATGCAHISELKLIDAMAEVNRSNYSKFFNGKPVFDENNKITKGPDYSKADLTPYV